MAAVPELTSPLPTAGEPRAGSSRSPGGRIIGLDLARAMAMLGMVIAHYLWPDESGTVIDLVAGAVKGRAMPLFVLLGGVGVTLAVSRFPSPDRALLVRAGLLFVLGLIAHEASEWVAVILQWYGLLFAAAPLLRRLPSAVLLAAAGAAAVLGGWTFQVFGTWPRVAIAWHDLDSPVQVIRALLVDGSYPLLPVGSFFMLGLVVGRLDLRSERIAAYLAAAGAAVGLGTMWLADAVVSARGIDPAVFDEAKRTPNPSGYDPSRFSATQLLDHTGHSQMLAWVVSAAGTAVAVVGLCLLVAPRLTTAAGPLVSLGRLALTFYIFQIVLTQWVPSPSTTGHGQEAVTTAAIYLGFAAFAHLWLRAFPIGPLEALLRLGTGRRRPSRSAHG